MIIIDPSRRTQHANEDFLTTTVFAKIISKLLLLNMSSVKGDAFSDLSLLAAAPSKNAVVAVLNGTFHHLPSLSPYPPATVSSLLQTFKGLSVNQQEGEILLIAWTK